MVVRWHPDPAFWQGRSVFLTGHTGFVGGWVASCLARMGAQVIGYSLDPPTTPSFHDCMRLGTVVRSTNGDVRDQVALRRAIEAASPQVLLHLAAQPLVGAAFHQPYDTFTTNVLGTLNVLEAAASANSIGALVVFTTDKVYASTGVPHRFREDDPLGGAEPYALSKASAEFAVAAYQHSIAACKHPRRALVTVRAGNIIGGGDWAADRLVPDAMRAFQNGTPLLLRKPNAVRPWQFILDAVGGLILLAEAAFRDPTRFSGAWNFGPIEQTTFTVVEVAAALVRYWGAGASWLAVQTAGLPETAQLEIDSTKAMTDLGWQPKLPLEVALARTVKWYRSFYGGADMTETTTNEIDEFFSAP